MQVTIKEIAELGLSEQLVECIIKNEKELEKFFFLQDTINNESVLQTSLIIFDYNTQYNDKLITTLIDLSNKDYTLEIVEFVSCISDIYMDFNNLNIYAL